MKNLTLPLEKAEALYKQADQSGKKLLRDMFPDAFVSDPYLIACQALGKTAVPPLTAEERLDSDRVSVDAYERLIICIRAKNMIDGEIWQPNYEGNERHYWPYFTKSPFGFSHSHSDSWVTGTTVGPRLEYRSEQLAEEGAKEFHQLYNDYFTQ